MAFRRANIGGKDGTLFGGFVCGCSFQHRAGLVEICDSITGNLPPGPKASLVRRGLCSFKATIEAADLVPDQLGIMRLEVLTILELHYDRPTFFTTALHTSIA